MHSIDKNIRNTIRQLIANGIAPYEKSIAPIIRSIYEANCGIVCDEHISFSHLEQTPFNKTDNRPLLFIGLKDRKDPLDVVWSILHEYGHIQQGPPGLDEVLKTENAEQAREKDAWDRAQCMMEQDPALKIYARHFTDYRDALLSSYSKHS
jgi:hypothetical protein